MLFMFSRSTTLFSPFWAHFSSCCLLNKLFVKLNRRSIKVFLRCWIFNRGSLYWCRRSSCLCWLLHSYWRLLNSITWFHWNYVQSMTSGKWTILNSILYYFSILIDKGWSPCHFFVFWSRTHKVIICNTIRFWTWLRFWV